MAKRYDLLVFDWDGTLIDSAAHIAASLQQAFRDLGLPVPSTRQARHVIGLGLQDAMAYLNPGLGTDRYEAVADRYRVHFLAGDGDVELFPSVATGIPALNLEGYLMGIATGKSRRGLDRSLLATGLAKTRPEVWCTNSRQLRYSDLLTSASDRIMPVMVAPTLSFTPLHVK